MYEYEVYYSKKTILVDESPEQVKALFLTI